MSNAAFVTLIDSMLVGEVRRILHANRDLYISRMSLQNEARFVQRVCAHLDFVECAKCPIEERVGHIERAIETVRATWDPK